MTDSGSCRFCGKKLKHSFCDLGSSPLSNSYLNSSQIKECEGFYPLHAFVCESCYLVQLKVFQSPKNIFSEYAYFSSYSDSWLLHSSSYVHKMMERFYLNDTSQVVEIASNDGYLLQFFKEAGVPVLGVEPAENVADVAIGKGIPTWKSFFGVECAEKLQKEGFGADLIVGNNVLAHVPDLNDFVAGLQYALKPEGIITMEFPHLLKLMQYNQYDTIYHEHFSYFSLITVQKVFEKHGMELFDVEQLETHGGSLRIYVCLSENKNQKRSDSVDGVIRQEIENGLDALKAYSDFEKKVYATKRDLLEFLIQLKNQNKQVVGYGAPAKGNTLLNFCGIRKDFIDYTVDRSPHKQGLHLPGTHIRIYDPEMIRKTKPDYLLILPWNIKNEIMDQMAYIRDWGGKFIIPIPSVEVVS